MGVYYYVLRNNLIDIIDQLILLFIGLLIIYITLIIVKYLWNLSFHIASELSHLIDKWRKKLLEKEEGELNEPL